MDDFYPRIAITPGEPAGCGPDLAIQLANANIQAELVCICDPLLLEDRANQLGVPLTIETFNAAITPKVSNQNTIKVLPVPLTTTAKPGILNRDNAAYVLECLKIACEGCLVGTFDAMTTGPVQKSIINDAGIAFSGHTEYLAEICNAYPVMMLTNSRVRVALVTTHIPLNQVSKAITQESLKKTIMIVNTDLQQRFGIDKPKILICGLNPHAGESGHLGSEEISTITPIIEELKDSIDLTGPLPADTVFTEHWLKQADVVISMFHDQGLPALKALGFGETVNVTLGLPIIRTSVDHGTALDLAGTGKAQHSSLLAAVNMAVELATNQQQLAEDKQQSATPTL